MKKTSTKLWKVMKICAVQMMILIVACGISAAHESHAQVLERKVTVSVKDVSLETLIREIEGSARVRIFYSIDQLGVARPVSLQVVDRPLGEVLDEFFSPLQINFKVDEKREVITLKRRRSTPVQEETGMTDPPATRKGALLSVTGIVTDAATQLPMAGVNILVKGTTIGTTTDAEGRYSIEARDNDVLVFSFIGYVTFETVVNARSTIDVIMEVDTKNLDEVVINAGYWKVSDVERTGNISRVEAKEIERQPVSNPMAALIGRMPGVYITENSGVPGSGFSVRIRGRNSLRADGNEPLYIVDGIPYPSVSTLQVGIFPSATLINPSPLSNINPLDIESIEVLKDADATAIYGSRGANGVILITTKKAKESGTKLDVNISQGTGRVGNQVDLLNTEQYLEMRNEAFSNDGLTPGILDYDVNGTWDQSRYTDWQKVFLGNTANFTNAQVSLSGGSAHTHFNLGVGVNRQTTVFPGDMFYQRGNVHLNFKHSSENGRFAIDLTNSVGLENSNLADVSFTQAMYSLPPNAPPLYDEDGMLNWDEGRWANPLAALEQEYDSRLANLITNFNLWYEVLPSLRVGGNFGYNSIHTRENAIRPIRAFNPYVGSQTGAAFFGRSTGTIWIAEPQAEFRTKLGAANMAALLGVTFQANDHESLSISASGIEHDELLENLASAPRDLVTTSNSFRQYRYLAAFARINYNIRDKYFVNLTARRDGSSRFGPDKQFGNFGAIGAAWIFSSENFAKNTLKILSFGKLRGSFGVTGSDQIGDYGYLDSYRSTVDQYQGPGLIPSRLANPDYAWETSRKLEGAIELTFLRDRISIVASYYQSRSGNQLVGLTMPGTTGFTSIQYNLPAIVRNTGWEFELTSMNISADNLQWTSNLNVSIPRNKLIEYPSIERSVHASTYRVGEPLNIALTYVLAQVDPSTGIYQYNDLDNSGAIGSGDRIQVTQAGVRYYGSIQNTLRFMNFDFSCLFQFVNQTTLTYRNEFTTPGRMGNQPVHVMDRWRSVGDISDVQRFSTTNAVNTANTRYKQSDAAYEGSSFVRLKNVSLSWQLPSSWTRPVHVLTTRVFVQAQNLLTWTAFMGLDPENRNVPPLRMITMGLQMTF